MARPLPVEAELSAHDGVDQEQVRLSEGTPDSQHGTRRWWPLAVLLVILGLADLAVRGWSGDARVLLLAGVAMLTLTRRPRVGRIALVVCTVLLAVYALFLVPWLGRTPLAPARWIPSVVFFLITGSLVHGALRRLDDGIAARVSQARHEERQLAKSILETRFDGLQESIHQMRRQVALLEATLSVIEALPGINDLDHVAFLNRVAEVIAERFGFSHVGIYLCDEGREWLVLRGASSVVGKARVLDGHRWRMGEEKPIGWVAFHDAPLLMEGSERRSLDVPNGEVAAAADAAAPAATLTLPLRDDVSGGAGVLGVLDLASGVGDPGVLHGSWSEPDVASLQRLANCLARAVREARHRHGDSAPLVAQVPAGPQASLQDSRPGYGLIGRLAAARSEREVYDLILAAVANFGPTRALFVELPVPDQAAEYGGVDAHTPALVYAAEMREGAVDPLGQAYDLSDLGAVGLVDVIILGSTLDRPLWLSDLANLDAALNPELREALVGLTQGEGAALAYPWEHKDPGKVVDGGPGGEAKVAPAALCFVPIRTAAGNPVGGVLLLYPRVHRFSSEERHLHELIVELGGEALAAARLSQGSADAALELETLYRCSRALLNALTPQGVLAALGEFGVPLGADAVPAFDRGMLIVPHVRGGPGTMRPDGEVMRIDALWVRGLGDDAEADWTRRLADRRLSGRQFPALSDIVDGVAVIEDVTTDVGLDVVSQAWLSEQAGLRGALILPLIAEFVIHRDGRLNEDTGPNELAGPRAVLGWLVMGSTTQTCTFPARAMRVYQSVQALAATVVHNFQLRTLAKQRATHAQVVGDVSTRLREALDMDLVLQTALREIGERLGISSIEVQMRRRGDGALEGKQDSGPRETHMPVEGTQASVGTQATTLLDD